MDAPIGLFDSGFGGLTVMKELVQILPNENLIYLGDTANLPYGNKSPEAVIEYARKNGQFLLNKGIKLLMIPCHTACCHALEILQNEMNIPVVGVIEPGIELIKPFQKVAVLGTTSTIESGLYQRLIQKQNPKSIIFAKACPLFVPLVEEGFHKSKAAELIAEKSLQEMKGQIEAALLACTHYPLMKEVISSALGANVILIEPSQACAKRAYEILKKEQKLRISKEPPTYQFYATDDPKKFQKLGFLFWGKRLENVELNKNS